MAANQHVSDSTRSSLTVGDNDAHNAGPAPSIPNKEAFDDDSKVPFLTARTIMMTILVSVGGIMFGFDTGQISGFLEV